jgi:predicted small metal-binding protein
MAGSLRRVAAASGIETVIAPPLIAPTSLDKSSAVPAKLVRFGDDSPATSFVSASREAIMVKVFECGSVVPGCRFVAHDESRDELVVTAVEHLHRVHEIEQLSESLKARVRAIIKDDVEAGR